MNAYISLSEFYTFLILIVTILKFGFDFLLSPWFRRQQRRNGLSPEQAAKAKGKRDRKSNLFTFLALSILSSLVLLEGFSSTDVSREDIDRLQSQIDEIRFLTESENTSTEKLRKESTND
ncbi:hypothetical protein [Thioclava sp. IC9]|uniref:hypothetical protein n=1 Tax=Thioclava sp. IC9 TaxID=1973007 RepID=UPI000B544498|nr:hypothetical protein [Thioclava sp. IC9]OWY02305.1 hypothetical protein B6V76_12850 [Thioclava sp. IC9]